MLQLAVDLVARAFTREDTSKRHQQHNASMSQQDEVDVQIDGPEVVERSASTNSMGSTEPVSSASNLAVDGDDDDDASEEEDHVDADADDEEEEEDVIDEMEDVIQDDADDQVEAQEEPRTTTKRASKRTPAPRVSRTQATPTTSKATRRSKKAPAAGERVTKHKPKVAPILKNKVEGRRVTTTMPKGGGNTKLPQFSVTYDARIINVDTMPGLDNDRSDDDRDDRDDQDNTNTFGTSKNQRVMILEESRKARVARGDKQDKNMVRCAKAIRRFKQANAQARSGLLARVKSYAERTGHDVTLIIAHSEVPPRAGGTGLDTNVCLWSVGSNHALINHSAARDFGDREVRLARQQYEQLKAIGDVDTRALELVTAEEERYARSTRARKTRRGKGKRAQHQEASDDDDTTTTNDGQTNDQVAEGEDVIDEDVMTD